MSTGPSRKVDLRQYPKGVAPSKPSTPKKTKRRRSSRAPQSQSPGRTAPHELPSLSAFSNPFRRFVEPISGKDTEWVTVYAIVKRTSARYVRADNKRGVRTFAVQLGTMKRSQARRLTIGDVRDAHKCDPDGVLAVVQLKGKAVIYTPAKGDPTRQAIANAPKMRRYLRSLSRGFETRSGHLKERKRYTETRKGKKRKGKK